MERIKPLAATFRAMKVGDVVTLPICQLASYSTTYYRTLAPERSQGFMLSVRQDVEKGVINVTRTA